MKMDLRSATEALQFIFWQAVTDEPFFFSLGKIGVSFQDWPDQFAEAKQFEITAKSKTHKTAVVELQSPIPDAFFESAKLSLEDVKAIHQTALDVVRGVELGRALLREPHKSRELVSTIHAKIQKPATMLRLFEVIERTVRDIEDRIKNDKTLVKIQGFEILSSLMDGFNPGRVSIFTAPTGFGKTNLGLSLFAGAIRSGLKSIFVNMEMAVEDIGARLMQIQARLTRDELKRPEYIQKLSNAGVLDWAINNSDFWLTDGRSMSLSDIATMVQVTKRAQPINLVFIDYDQKIEMTGKDEEWRFLQKAVQELEEMAKRESVHVVLFSQANDDGLPRASLRAMQPASAVVYFHKENEQFRLKFLKNRFGPTDRFLIMNYDPSISAISEERFDFFTPQTKPKNASEAWKPKRPYVD